MGSRILDGSDAAARLSGDVHVLAARLVFPRAGGFRHYPALASDHTASTGERWEIQGKHSDASFWDALLYTLHRCSGPWAYYFLLFNVVSRRTHVGGTHLRHRARHADRGQLSSVLLCINEHGSRSKLCFCLIQK